MFGLSLKIQPGFLFLSNSGLPIVIEKRQDTETLAKDEEFRQNLAATKENGTRRLSGKRLTRRGALVFMGTEKHGGLT